MEMSNSNKDNLEDAAESSPKLNEDAKSSKFNKTKSISEVFSKLELSEDLEEDSVGDIAPANDDSVIIPLHDEAEEEDIFFIRDEDDEIIPIHNEYGAEEAYSNEISEGGLILNPVDDDPLDESDVDEIENTEDSLNLKSDENDDSEAISDEIVPELFKKDDDGDISDEKIPELSNDIEEESSNQALDDEKLENTKPSSQGVIINSNTDEDEDSKTVDSSFIFSGIGFVVGLVIFIFGLIHYTTASDRVVDNVLSGETAGMAVMIIIIGLIILAFSVISFISSRKSSRFMDAFSDIRSIDYDEIKNDTFSRDDFESAFTNVFKRDNTENEDDETPVKNESEGSAEASIGSLIGSLRKGRSSKSNDSSQSDENTQNSSSSKFKSADDFDSYIEPIHMESSAQDTIFNNSDAKDEPVDDSDIDFNDLDDGSSDDDFGAGSSLDADFGAEDSTIEPVGDANAESIEDIGIKSRVVDEDAGFEVFVPDSDSDSIDVDAIKADSIHKFKKSLNLDDILDDGKGNEMSSDVENSNEDNN